MLRRSTELDTTSLQPLNRHAAYMEAIGNSFATDFLSKEIVANLVAYAIADQRLVSLTASQRRSERTATLIASDGRDQINFQYIVSGNAYGRVNGRPIESVPGSLLIFDLQQPFLLVDMEPRTVINLEVPRPSIATLIDDPRRLHGLTVSGGASTLLSNMMNTVMSMIAYLPAISGPAIASAFCSLISVLIASIGGRSGAANVDLTILISERALKLIDSRIGSRDLTPEWLARELNISRSQLYALFQNHGGVSRLIWRRRLELAHAALSAENDRRRIREMAFSLGFATESHFARSFKDAFGISPKAFRKAALLPKLDPSG